MNYPPPGAFAATALLLAAAPAFGQSPLRPTPKPDPAPGALTVVAESGEKRFDIELKGETAEQAVQQLVEKVGYPINVIFTGDSAAFQLPRLQLRKVTLTEFFAAIKAAGRAEEKSGRQGCEFEPVEGAANIYTFSVIEPAQNRWIQRATGSGATVSRNMIGGGSTTTPAPIVAEPVRTSVGPPPPAQWAPAGSMVSAKSPQKTTLFFDLSKILDKTLTIEDVTTAIRTGWTAAADGKEPDPGALKFHQESKLLIATGPPEHLDAVTNIVKLLENRRQPVKDEQERIIESLRYRVEEMNERNQRLEAKLAEREKNRDATVLELRDQIAKLEIELAKRAPPQ